MDQKAQQRVQELIDAQVADGRQIGVQVAAYLDGERFVEAVSGTMGPDDPRPMQHDSLSCVFSATKGIGALAIHQLADRGLLDYDEPVATYWPDFAQHGKERATVLQAVSHQVGRWSLEVLLKLGLGNNRSEVFIDGSTTNTVPNVGSATFTGGLLAQTTNIGWYQRDAFGVVPELGVFAARELGCGVRLTAGYNLLYWTALLRPGDQIDREVSQFPPEPAAGRQQPEFPLRGGSFWAQGLQAGVDSRF